MAGFDDPAFYGDRWAAVYDDHHGQMDPGPAVEFLAGLAGDGRVLELAIGTGRVALPLAARGITVEGVDASAAMVERLRAKPGGDSIPVAMGDMAQVPVSGRFRLVYLVFNTLFGLLSQARQAECFGNVARVLDPGGMFVIECFVPDLARFDHDQRVQARTVTEDSAIIEVSRHDRVQQRVTTPDDHAGWPGDAPAASGHSLQLADRAGPDGRPGRPAANRTLGRLGPASVHFGQRRPRLCLSASLTSSDETSQPNAADAGRLSAGSVCIFMQVDRPNIDAGRGA
jgi:SAM-dependent methyltransferase